MRLYFHFEEEEPNHTAVLTASTSETTLEHLLQQFLDVYAERFGASAVELSVGSCELKNGRGKKLRKRDKAAGQLKDKDDIFVHRTSKSSRPGSARPSASPKPPPPSTVPSSSPAAFVDSSPTLENHPRARIEILDDDDDADDVATPSETLAQQLSAMAGGGMGIGSIPAARTDADAKFRFAGERAAVSLGAQDMEPASPHPTPEHHIQANCLKCKEHIFYKSVVSFVTCHKCKFMMRSVECPQCGTFFPMGTETEAAGCPVCSCSSSSSEFEARRARSMDDADAPPPRGEPNEIHLIVQYYIDKDEERQGEVEECLRRNIANPLIRHVHVLTEQPMDLTAFFKADKVVQYVQGSWLTYVDAMAYCQRFLRGKICILANADIHFDETLAAVRKMDLSGRCLALTRHDVRPDGLGFNAGAAPISQDAWIFQAPLPSSVRNCDFRLGKPGCDNRFAFELRAGGLRVSNPCFKVIVHHRHMSEKRNYVHGPDTVVGNYSAVIPIASLS